MRLRLIVDGPGRVEDFVAAVFAVGLREHVELDVGGVAAECGELADEVVDLVGCEREAEATVGFLDGGGAASENVDGGKRLRCVFDKELLQFVEAAEEDGLGHAVVQCGEERLHVVRAVNLDDADAFDALGVGEAGVDEDVSGFAGPRRLRADARSDEDRRIGERCVGELEQLVETVVIEIACCSDEVEKVGVNAGHGGVDGAEAHGEAVGLEAVEGSRTRQREDADGGTGRRCGFRVRDGAGHLSDGSSG